ncbi:MAG: 23S rRNA (adenine(2503)-C(2))-methyltransferase RlmN [Firmicutes bacterium]|nr:23S rRNA (adenine(2503)-C(2))-methyltransferase RlmN [Bacillota bacterium]
MTVSRVEFGDVLSMTEDELASVMGTRGASRFRGRQLFEGLWRLGIQNYQELTVWPLALREEMTQAYPFQRLRQVHEETSPDGTVKFLLALKDGQRVETVVLPHRYGYSVCVSSQVGCAMGCKFCASGLKGRVRQLTAGEMADQVMYADQWLKQKGQRVSRVDVMGIGEPLDNFEAVVRFLELIHHPRGLHLSYRHMTVSTSGIVPNIRRLADQGLPVTLAVSLHAPNDALRSRLMPVNRAYPLHQLMGAARYFAERTGRRVTYEYLLLKDVNDRDQHAEELARLLRGQLAHVNLIPWNPVAEHPFQPSPSGRVQRFQRIVQQAGISCTIRKELGQEIEAACGQLRLREEERVSP